MLEVNMESSPKTLHFFVNGVQQKGFYRNIPDSVRFTVCLHLHHSLSHSNQKQQKVTMLSQNNAIRCVSLESVEKAKAESVANEEGFPYPA